VRPAGATYRGGATVPRAARFFACSQTGGWWPVLVVAAGVAVAAAAFSVIGAAFWWPAPLPQIDRLAVLAGAAAPPDGRALHWWRRAHSFGAVAIAGTGGANLAGGTPERIGVTAVSAGFFSLAGVEPRLGRAFADSEDGSGAAVAIVSDAFWRDHLAGDPRVLGRHLMLDGRSFEIIGVMPPNFNFPDRSQVWVPRSGPGYRGALGLGPSPEEGEAPPFRIEMLGRLRPGVTFAAADRELQALLRRESLGFARSGLDFGSSVLAIPLRQFLSERSQWMLELLGVGAALLFLIAAGSAAFLQSLSYEMRRGEMALRRCCGATWPRLIRERAIGALVGGALAAGLGLAVAAVLTALARHWLAGDLSLVGHAHIGAETAAFSVAAGVLATMTTSLPGLARLRRAELARDLRSELMAGARPHARLRRGLVVCQIALTLALSWCALMVGAGLARAAAVKPGFATAQALAARVSVGSGRAQDRRAVVTSALRSVLAAAAAVPGITAVAAANQLPLSGGIRSLWVAPAEDAQRGTTGPVFEVAGDYLAAMGIPLLRGESLSDDSADGRLVALVNETCARRFWGRVDALGKTIVVGDQKREVVGVVGDVRAKSLFVGPGPQVYLPLLQAYPNPPGDFSVVVRFRGSPAAIAAALRNRIGAAAGVPVYGLRKLRAASLSELSSERAAALVLGVFSGIAIALAVAGVYGFIASGVAQRKEEMAIRTAIGAEPRHLAGLVLGELALLVLPATALGSALAFWAGGTLRALVFGLFPAGPWPVAAVAGLICAAAFAAALPQVIRVTRLPPAAILRRN